MKKPRNEQCISEALKSSKTLTDIYCQFKEILYKFTVKSFLPGNRTYQF